jgi:hypothetical protein
MVGFLGCTWVQETELLATEAGGTPQDIQSVEPEVTVRSRAERDREG